MGVEQQVWQGVHDWYNEERKTLTKARHKAITAIVEAVPIPDCLATYDGFAWEWGGFVAYRVTCWPRGWTVRGARISMNALAKHHHLAIDTIRHARDVAQWRKADPDWYAAHLDRAQRSQPHGIRKVSSRARIERMKQGVKP